MQVVGTPILVKSRSASSGTVYDIEVVAIVDGFTSDPLRLHINTPSRLKEFHSQTVSNDKCAPGYRTEFYYKVIDLWGNEIIELGVNEDHSEAVNPNGSNWPDPASDTWEPGNREQWIDQFTFLDTLFAGSCPGSGLVPGPTDPGGNGSSDNLQFLNKQTVQSFGAGSLIRSTGSSVQRKHARWYLDHGKVQSIQ